MQRINPATERSLAQGRLKSSIDTPLLRVMKTGLRNDLLCEDETESLLYSELPALLPQAPDVLLKRLSDLKAESYKVASSILLSCNCSLKGRCTKLATISSAFPLL